MERNREPDSYYEVDKNSKDYQVGYANGYFEGYDKGRIEGYERGARVGYRRALCNKRNVYETMMSRAEKDYKP